MATNRIRVAVGPEPTAFAVEAVQAGGGTVVALGQEADALVWLSAAHLDGLATALDRHPDVRWVQFPFAGVEKVFASGLIDDRRVWTCAKGSYARPVAEHALMLALSGLRLMPERITAKKWGQAAGTTIYGAPVTILGGGGITEELLRLLTPFEVDATVVRRTPDPVPGAARTVVVEQLDHVLGGSLVVFLALALTPATEKIIGERQLAAMGPQAWLVNVARGGHVDTDALVKALKARTIAGAALDVTDPEPLPDRHPLWKLPNCIITPHTADTWEMIVPPLKERIRENVTRFAAGQPLVGLVDAHAGY